MDQQKIRISKTKPISDIIQNESKELAELNQKPNKKRLFINCRAEEFVRLVFLKSNRIFWERGQKTRFIRDEHNKEIIKQLYYYAIGSDQFKGDLHKGLWFWSTEFGTGKTTMLQVIREIFNDHNMKSFPLIECKVLHEKIQNYSMEYFQNRILYFDDIGREIKDVNMYGTKIRPIPSIIHLREHYGSWTHATCNRHFEHESLKSLYGEVTTNRFKAMFNAIEFKGKTRRK